MLDINFIRQNLDKVKKASFDKGVEIDLDELLRVDDKRRKLSQEVDELRHQRNEAAKKRDVEKGKRIKEELESLEQELAREEDRFTHLMLYVPNLPLDDVPVGKDENENKVIRKWREPKKFEFKTKDHLELGELLDIVDVERAVKVSGARFSYLKGQGAILELALVNFALDTLVQQQFTPIIPPVLIKKESMKGMGYLEYGEEDMYVLEKDNLVLVGTSEQSIGPMHQNEILENLPLRYAGFSSCFRREAGSYGKDTQGILRVHQFDKVEMFSYTTPQDSNSEHEYFLSLEEKFFQSLEIPYQVVKMCTGDLGFPVARKYDLEAWMPAQGKYREVTSTSTTTDFQARRLNIKYQEKGKTDYVHTVNGTAFAIGRTIIAIVENFQQKDGSVKIPQVLVPYTNFSQISPK